MLALPHVRARDSPFEGVQLRGSYCPACLGLQSASQLHACSIAFAFAPGKNNLYPKGGNPLWSSVMRRVGNQRHVLHIQWMWFWCDPTRLSINCFQDTCRSSKVLEKHLLSLVYIYLCLFSSIVFQFAALSSTALAAVSLLWILLVI